MVVSKIVKVILATTILVIQSSLANPEGTETTNGPAKSVCEFTRTKLLRVLVAPDTFDGHCIQLVGVLSLDREGQSVYLSRDFYRDRLKDDSLAISDPHPERFRELVACTN
jgi:hypothetical protein